MAVGGGGRKGGGSHRPAPGPHLEGGVMVETAAQEVAPAWLWLLDGVAPGGRRGCVEDFARRGGGCCWAGVIGYAETTNAAPVLPVAAQGIVVCSRWQIDPSMVLGAVKKNTLEKNKGEGQKDRLRNSAGQNYWGVIGKCQIIGIHSPPPAFGKFYSLNLSGFSLFGPKTFLFAG